MIDLEPESVPKINVMQNAREHLCVTVSGFERHFKGLAPITPVGMRAFPRIMPFTAFRRACAFHKGMKGAARSGVALSQGPQFAMGLHPNNNGTRRGQSVLECAPHCSAMAPPLSLRFPVFEFRPSCVMHLHSTSLGIFCAS